MTQFIQIQWTAGTIDEARKVGRYLVQEHLVACVQIVPWIESIYMWNGEIETEQETKVVFKTIEANFNQIKSIIESNTKYEVPEITYTYLDGGNEEYFDWMRESTKAVDTVKT